MGVNGLAWTARVEVAAPPIAKYTGEGPPATPIEASGAVTERDTFPENPPWLARMRVVVL